MAKSTAVTSSTETGVTTHLGVKDVPAQIAKFEAMLKDLRKDVKESISLDIMSDNHSEKIKDITSVAKLMEISSSIDARGKAFNEALKRHNLAESRITPFKVSGKTPAEWKDIIDKAAFELINKQQIQQLENAITKLSQHLDAETKLDRDIKNIMNAASQTID